MPYQLSKSDPVRLNDSNRRSLDVVSTLRNLFSDDQLPFAERKRSNSRYDRDSHSSRSRSRSYSRTRSYKTSDRCKDRKGRRRSRSRRRHRHGREDRKDRRRRRRSSSEDRKDGRRSRSRSRQRRRVTPDRRYKRHSDERGRSKSPSKKRRDDTRRSRRSNSSERSASQSKNRRSSRKEDVQNRPASSSFDSLEKCATPDAADQKPPQNSFGSLATLEMLRSRIKSTLMNAKCNVSESRDEESVESSGGINIGYNIFNRVVSTATSTVATHSSSNINIDVGMKNELQFNPTNRPTTKISNSQFPIAQPVTTDNPTLLDQIKDPRIRKMILESPAVSDQRKPHQVESQPAGYWGSVHRTNEPKSAQMTYGEYKRQQSRGTAQTSDRANVSKSMPPAQLFGKTEEITKPEAVIHEIPKTSTTASTLHQHVPVVPTSMEKAMRKEVPRQAAVHQKFKPNKNIRSVPSSDQKSNEQDISVTSDEGKGSSLDQATTHLSALKELVNPQQLLTLLDLMAKMTENNSLAEVKEAIEKDVQPTQKQLISTGSTSAGYPTRNELERLKEDIDKLIRSDVLNANGREAKVKQDLHAECTNQVVTAAIKKHKKPTQKPRKKELDRLNEDIDNMFIRDGVLNAMGRQRNSTSSAATVKSSVNVAVDVKPKMKDIRRALSAGPVIKKEISDVIPASQISHNAVKMDKENGTRVVPEKPKVKNNNPEWHSLLKVLPCQICYLPPGQSLVSHYVNFHPDDEVLTSRLAPEAAQHLRSSGGIHPCERIRTKRGLVFKQFCYFCNTYVSYSKYLWINHIVRHTGYFNYKCNSCPHKFSSRANKHGCNKRNGVVERIEQPIFRQRNIVAYVCELCNYVRFYEDEIKMHLSNEHDDGDVKEYNEYLFLVFPKMKVKNPRKGESDICDEFQQESDTGDLSDEQHDSEIRCALQSKK